MASGRRGSSRFALLTSSASRHSRSGWKGAVMIRGIADYSRLARTGIQRRFKEEGKILTGGTAAIPTEPLAVVEHHRLVADRTIRRRNPGHRAQDVKVQVVVVFGSHMLPILFEPERRFGAFPCRDADKLQLAVNDRRRRGTNRVPFGQLLAVGTQNVHFPVAETMFDP